MSPIVEAIDPVQIICYGARSSVNETWSCFSRNHTLWHSHYDLLIVRKDGSHEKEHEILDKISKICKEPIQVTAVVHSITAVNSALTEGSMFFTTVYNKGIMIYDNYNASILAPVISNRITVERGEKIWNRWFTLANRFYESACDCAFREWNDASLFLLHQVVEHTCIAIIRVITGYKPTTHSIRRLLALIENFAPEIGLVFPQTTKEESEIFETLAKAYSNARYNEVYKVPSEMVFILLERVKQLQLMSEKLYKQKVNEAVVLNA